MSHVFMSYAHRDAQVADKLYQQLTGKGFLLWRDIAEIKGGQSWEAVIQRNLHSAAVVLLFWSQAASESQAVSHEFHSAIREGLSIVTLRLDGTPIPDALKPYQYLELNQVELRPELLAKALPALVRRSPQGFEFGKPLRDYATKERIQINDQLTLLSVPLLRSSYCNAFVVGHPDAGVKPVDKLPICLHFTRRMDTPFMQQVYSSLERTKEGVNARDFLAVYVTGPINEDRQTYWLDNENSAHWVDAVETTYEAVNRASGKKTPTLQIFSMATLPLMFAIGKRLYGFWRIQLFNLTGDSYQKVMEIPPSRA